jgi:hypothetical protein
MSLDNESLEPNPWRPDHKDKSKKLIKWFVETGALVILLVAVFYVGYLEGARHPATCILPMGNGDSFELKKVAP